VETLGKTIGKNRCKLEGIHLNASKAFGKKSSANSLSFKVFNAMRLRVSETSPSAIKHKKSDLEQVIFNAPGEGRSGSVNPRAPAALYQSPWKGYS
jgi:hypothetical protein